MISASSLHLLTASPCRNSRHRPRLSRALSRCRAGDIKPAGDTLQISPESIQLNQSDV